MKTYIKGLGALLFVTMVFATGVFAQDSDTATTVVQNPDGTYTVIQYPLDKETVVNLVPVTDGSSAKGTAKVMRSADGTKVMIDVNGIAADSPEIYAYAVDNMGKATLLGPIMKHDGMAMGEFMTSADKFMIVVTPNKTMTVYDPTTAVLFRSDVPAGQAVVPRGNTSWSSGKEKQVATSGRASSPYAVPMLNVPSFNDKTAEIRIDFSGQLEGLKGKAYVDPGAKGTTQIKMRFDDMKDAPKDKRYVLWAAAPDGSYTKLGQVINSGNREESEIRSETALKDFGLFVTVENKEVSQPTSEVYSVFRRP